MSPGYDKTEVTTLTEHQFHVVWTAAVGKEGYNKHLFMEVLRELIANGKVIPTRYNVSP